MLGIKTHAAAIAHAGVPSDFVTNQLAAGEQQLGFFVEEDEMLVDFEVSATYSGAAAGTLNVTLMLDGTTNLGHATGGLYLAQLGATLAEQTVYFSHTQRVAKGYHTVEVRVISSTTPTLQAATIPSKVVARRHSHPATLGHGVDSKAQLIQ